MRGVRTRGPMAPEIALESQRPAEFMFDHLVAGAVQDLHPPAQQPANSPPPAQARAGR